MENIAHSLAGVCIARAGFTEKVTPRAAFWTGLAAANLPDVDLLTYPLLGQEAYLLHHRGITHSLLALALVPPLVAWIARRFSSSSSFPALWFLAFLAYASHLAMDLPTSWGTMLLLPFSDVRFAADWVFIVDLMFWVILSIPFWLGRFVPIQSVQLNRITLLFLGAYVGLCGFCHEMALKKVAEAAKAQEIEVTELHAYPAAFLPVVWNGVAGDSVFWHQGGIQLLGGHGQALNRKIARNLDQRAVAAAIQTPIGKRFVTWWANAPYAEVRCVGERRWVVLRDLRLENPWLGLAGFQLAIEMSRENKSSPWEARSRRWISWFLGKSLPEADCLNLHNSADP
ncbi:MAG TPA: metal-dependent hydrolase [Myxococcales bacterium]|nr:metal-dependent hydrolase [Myxococcales bacterium]HIN86359.1 metal-dependent hydrolase [Myxococcales bacterium]